MLLIATNKLIAIFIPVFAAIFITVLLPLFKKKPDGHDK